METRKLIAIGCVGLVLTELSGDVDMPHTHEDHDVWLYTDRAVAIVSSISVSSTNFFWRR